MKKLSLMSWSDSNMAGDCWTWLITLTIRKNDSYSVSAIQTAVDALTYRLPAIYPLRKGRQVREAIEIDWQGVITVLTKHVPELAQEIAQSFIEDEIADEASELEYEAQEKLNAPINDWVARAKWPLSPMSHHIGNQMDNAKRRKWVFEYVRDYLSKHDRFPAGSHTLHLDFKVQFPEG